MWPNHQQHNCNPFLQRGLVNNSCNVPQGFSAGPDNNSYTLPQTHLHHSDQQREDQFDHFPQSLVNVYNPHHAQFEECCTF